MRPRRAWSIVIYSFAAFAAISITDQTRGAVRGRAERIIAACEHYRIKAGRYPVALEQLVPDCLPAIPSARRTLIADPRFRYFVTGPNHPWVPGDNWHVLAYTSLPPFGKTFYVFESKEWRFRD